LFWGLFKPVFDKAFIVSQNANDQGWFVVVKTKLTTKRKRECKGRRDYIYVTKG
jgi:hypothetical protein